MVDFGQKRDTRWRTCAEETKDSAAQGEEIWPNVKYAETTIICHLKLHKKAEPSEIGSRLPISLHSQNRVHKQTCFELRTLLHRSGYILPVRFHL
jgi:hypothetical protein